MEEKLLASTYRDELREKLKFLIIVNRDLISGNVVFVNEYIDIINKKIQEIYEELKEGIYKGYGNKAHIKTYLYTLDKIRMNKREYKINIDKSILFMYRLKLMSHNLYAWVTSVSLCSGDSDSL